jgi:exodeoxyribonuclease-3
MKKDFAGILQKLDADIIGLQEIKAKPEQIIAEMGIILNSAERPGYSGTAVFTRIPPLAVINCIGTDADNEGRTLALEFEDFYYITTYVPNTKDDLSRLPYRQEWDRAMCSFVKKLQTHKPVILCGDLNVAHQPIDLKNPKQNEGSHGFTHEERHGFDNFLDAGLVDIFREQHPGEEGFYTWWSNF